AAAASFPFGDRVRCLFRENTLRRGSTFLHMIRKLMRARTTSQPARHHASPQHPQDRNIQAVPALLEIPDRQPCDTSRLIAQDRPALRVTSRNLHPVEVPI